MPFFAFRWRHILTNNVNWKILSFIEMFFSFLPSFVTFFNFLKINSIFFDIVAWERQIIVQTYVSLVHCTFSVDKDVSNMETKNLYIIYNQYLLNSKKNHNWRIIKAQFRALFKKLLVALGGLWAFLQCSSLLFWQEPLYKAKYVYFKGAYHTFRVLPCALLKLTL